MRPFFSRLLLLALLLQVYLVAILVQAQPSGPVAAYSFNEASGPSVADSSGNGNNGTIPTPVWTTQGKYGGALSFGAFQNRVVIPDSASLDLTSGMTLSAWVYPTADRTGWDTIILKEQPAGLAYALYQGDTDAKPVGIVYSSGAEREAAGPSNLALNAWTYLAITFDGTELRLYVNGSLVKTTAYTGAIVTSTMSLGIGGNSYWSNENFIGRIDEVRIYNRAISQTEIQADMNTAIQLVPQTPTATRTPSSTPTVARTPTRTSTPTVARTPTRTSTPTTAPIPSPSRTSTATTAPIPSPSRTPTAGATPTPIHTSPPVYPLKLSANNRYLVDQTNRPVFWSGDTAWSLIAQVTKPDVDYYLNNRQQKGFNVILVNLLEHRFATNAPRNIYGDAPFTGRTFTTPNESYFAHADYVISAASQRGIAVLLVPLYLGYGCSSEGWCAEVQAASTSDMQSWGQYVGNRYRNYDNIVWVVGGDMDPSAYGVQDKVNAFATALQQADTRHLITAHNVREQMAVSPWSQAAWLTVNNSYTSYSTTYQQAQTAYSYSPTKPFFHVEGYYENEHSMTTQQLRAQAYWSVLSGAFGHVFGNCPLWGLGAPAASFCPGAGSDWKAQLDRPGSAGMVYVGRLFSPRNWQNLIPDWGHTVVTAGYGTYGGADYSTAARTADGSLVIAYLPSIRTITVDMTRLSGPVRAQWYDPASGTYTTISGSPFANTGSRQFTPPGNNSGGNGDWVLVLEV